MLTELSIRNFKLFEEIVVELGERVVFVGPNNSGKSSALQALALWNLGVRRWVEKRGNGKVPKERSGVTINRRDLIAIPVPTTNLLWRDLHCREGYKDGGKPKTRNILIEIGVQGVSNGKVWSTLMEFDYANEESFYCRSTMGTEGTRLDVPQDATDIRLAYLPPMSGLTANETRLDDGAIAVRVGEGRTAEVLRNLCLQVLERDEDQWNQITEWMNSLFGVQLLEPQYIKERGEIVMSYRKRSGVVLDLSASGRGQQQTLLLLSYMSANPGTVLLLDEPDAHLEVLRQRQIYQVLSQRASETASQIIVASHSEVILNEAADRDIVVAFLGTPHRIDDRGAQVRKSLKEIGFEQYLQAEQEGWVLYLEGSTDLAILRAFADQLDHPARHWLERPFVHYVANQPKAAQHHFHGLREAKSDLVGIAIFDRLKETLPDDPHLKLTMWIREEIENYLCHETTLLNYAEVSGKRQLGDLFAPSWRTAMQTAINEISHSLDVLGKPSPWSGELKASDDFLDRLFVNFYNSLGLPNLMRKTDYHALAPFVDPQLIDSDVIRKLDFIAETALRARPAVSRLQ